MSQYSESPVKGFTAATAIALYLRVTLTSGKAALAGAGVPGIGTIETASLAADAPCSVRLWSATGTRKMVANAAISAGALVYAAASGKVGSSGTFCVGRALEASTANNDVIEVLCGHPDLGAARITRTRFTIAEVNAGATLLPAMPGLKYRVHDLAMISIGGAAGASTTVDVLATQSSSSVKLMAAAIAALTQNTLLRAGAANATILAGGASFVANDANTAVTVGVTGSALTTATHIDVLVTYSIEA